MTPLQSFARAVTEARKVFDAGRNMTAWLAFYEAKQAAYSALSARLPQVKAIQGFWRYVQNMRAAEWLPIMETEVAQIARIRSLCHECGLAEINWPERRCVECKRTRRLDAYRKAKERMRAKQRMRTCSVCLVQPLNIRRQRVCVDCQKLNRRKRNQRYQKSLKDAAIRRVQLDSANVALSTIPPSQLPIRLAGTVDPEGVLAGGVAQ